jgi:drug/metabolite transporter (DMT)-like permease
LRFLGQKDQGLNKVLSAIKASKVDLVLLAVAIVWGASYLSAKAITPYATVPAMLSVRFAIATLAMVAIWLIRRKKFSKTDLVLGTVFGLTQSAIMSVETFGLKITSATNAGLLISLTIIFTPIMESAWNKRWLPRSFFLAAVGAIVGVALLVTGNGIQEPNFGDVLLFIAAIVRAVHVTAQGVLTRNKEASSFNMILMQCLTATVVFFVFDVQGAFDAIESFGPAQWAGTLFLALFCSVFAFVAQLWAIRRTSASRSSLLLATEPIWAVVIAVLFGGETLALLGIVGAVVIIASTYVGQGIESRHREQFESQFPKN